MPRNPQTRTRVSTQKWLALGGLFLFFLALSGLALPAYGKETGLTGLERKLDPKLDKCPPSKDLILTDGQPGMVCCPDQHYVLCSQSSCTLLAGVAVCECQYMGKGVSLATPYSSLRNPKQPDGASIRAPWTREPVTDVCQYMEQLVEVDKVLSTFNPENYKYDIAGTYICEDATDMIWAQCDGAVCEVRDGQGKPKPSQKWKRGDKSICTCQAVQSPALMPGPVSLGKDGRFEPSPEFASRYCKKQPKLTEIDYPETGVHIAVPADPGLFDTPLYEYLFGFYGDRIFDVEQTECQVITPAEL